MKITGEMILDTIERMEKENPDSIVKFVFQKNMDGELTYYAEIARAIDHEETEE